MNRSLTIVWLVLMLLTSASYAFGGRNDAVWLLLVVAGLKFSLVAWHFMELRHAARRWSFIVAALLLLILGTSWLLA